jgi:hypothetical protein
MARRPSLNNVIAYPDIRASGQACENATSGVVVPLVAYQQRADLDCGELLGEAFTILSGLDPEALERWVSALRRGLLPGS